MFDSEDLKQNCRINKIKVNENFIIGKIYEYRGFYR